MELFGQPGSGKTYLRDKIKTKLENLGFKVFDTRELIINYICNYTQVNLFKKTFFLFFRFLLFFGIKTTLWNKVLSDTCKAFLKTEIKKKYFINKVNLILKGALNENKLYKLWIDELIVASLLFKKIRKNNKKIFFFPDEGFLQRVFLIYFDKHNVSKKRIDKFLKSKIFCDMVVNVNVSNHKIIKINKNFAMHTKKIENKILKNKKIKFQKLKNYKEINSQIHKILLINK